MIVRSLMKTGCKCVLIIIVCTLLLKRMYESRELCNNYVSDIGMIK